MSPMLPVPGAGSASPNPAGAEPTHSDRFTEIMHIVMVLTTVWVPEQDQPILCISRQDLEATHEAGRELVKLTAALLSESLQRKFPL